MSIDIGGMRKPYNDKENTFDVKDLGKYLISPGVFISTTKLPPPPPQRTVLFFFQFV